MLETGRDRYLQKVEYAAELFNGLLQERTPRQMERTVDSRDALSLVTIPLGRRRIELPDL